MNKLLKPTLYYKDLYNINYKKLKENNIQYLLLDIDNTIGDSKERYPSKKAINFIKELQSNFTIILMTNALPPRAKRYAESIGVPYFAFSLKPFKINYKNILKKYNAPKSNVAAIGDQIFTDVLGANKMGITSILIDKISNNESIITKFNRIRENRIIKKYKIIERGKYNE